MAWDPTKPANGDLVFNSVGSTAIRGNFAAIDTAWDVNHVGIGVATHEGKHNAIQMREVSTPSTTTNEIALYCINPALTAQGSELYIRRESNGVQIPATASNEFSGIYNSGNGWTFLPSGILIKWGSVNTAGGDQSINFTTGSAYPAFTEVYRAALTPRDSASGDSDDAIRLKNITTTTLSYYGSPRTTTGAKAMTFDWIVIGLGV